MKRIILCDDGDIKNVSRLSRKYNLGIEIQSFYDPSVCEDANQIAIHKKLIKGITPLSLHAPFGDLCPGSFDPMVRDLSKNRFELGCRVAMELGISHIIFHTGYVPGAGPMESWGNRCIDFWNKFLEGKPENLNYYIENLFDHDAKLLTMIIEGINKDNVKVCLDIGHAHCHSKISVVEWIKTLREKIGYVHLHDNNGEKDEHFGIGKGNIPMKEVFKALSKYSPDAILAIETNVGDIEESIEQVSSFCAL